MIIQPPIIMNLNIESLEDLPKLKPFTESNDLKLNKSQIARELGVDRRTVSKYLDGFHKSPHRSSTNCLTPYLDQIRTLLLDPENEQEFAYRRVLWQYLRDNHGYTGSYSNFVHYLNQIPEFQSYFKARSPHSTEAAIRYETERGKQAQLDWKESMRIRTTDMGWVEVNIFVLLLSFSRFRVYRLSLVKTQDVLFHFLDDAFQTFGGVPKEIVTDNMKTVMDEARTRHSSGKVNGKFQQFADDYGFRVQPCVAATPRTKGKVESPMRILDELRAYNGKLSFVEFADLLQRINDRENSRIHPENGRLPLKYLQKERDFLNPLPRKSIRSLYQIHNRRVRVNSSSLFHYKGSQYSVPPEYIGEVVVLQTYDEYIHVYFNTKLIALHPISSQRINYQQEHYCALAELSHAFPPGTLEARARENLKALGAMYE